MKLFRLPILMILVAIFFQSCEKETPEEPIVNDPPKETGPTVEDYYPLDVGNYWVYDCYKIVDGQEEWFREDSLSIDGTVMIDGKEYYVQNSWQIDMIPPEYVRVEGNTIVDDLGNVQFSIDVSDDIIRKDEYPGFVNIEYSMVKNTDKVSTLENTYDETLNFFGHYNWQNNKSSVANIYNHYYKGIGRIAYSRFPCWEQWEKYIFKLKRYKVKKKI